MKRLNDLELTQALMRGAHKYEQEMAAERARELEREQKREEMNCRYRNMILQLLPWELRPYADLAEVRWIFTIEPNINNSTQEQVMIYIPGHPDMRAWVSKFKVEYIVPSVTRVVDEDGTPYASLEYGTVLSDVTKTDDYELALGCLQERKKQIDAIAAEIDRMVERRR